MKRKLMIQIQGTSKLLSYEIEKKLKRVNILRNQIENVTVQAKIKYNERNNFVDFLFFSSFIFLFGFISFIYLYQVYIFEFGSLVSQNH